ncbi:thioredoxin domain-containing protein [candidate division KSB1 bacterium]|nr:thioredoxin domain-containing protein [candidate division KSB1 bacterium]
MNQPKYTNHLIHATSPYLLQHAHNPVNWYPWGEQALQLSRANNLPIFLSIGYSACHWCHVMEHETFENEAIAQILNAHFVSIKVDREERPDIDEIYMNAVQAMTGSGGWPLSVWLTPDLKPFFGGTYFPPEDRQGRTGFKRILEQIHTLWQNQPESLLRQGEKLTAHLEQIADIPQTAQNATIAVWHEAFKQAERRFDELNGGFGSAPKFPQAMDLSFLLRYYFHTGEKRALEIAEKSLQAMAAGGIFDHLGGGFHRYATDARWRIPHFEKMLYDNALLPVTFLEAFQLTGVSLYADVARATLDYVLREMTSPEGGFYSSQDADSEGEEGKFYVWRIDEIDRLLSEDDAKLFCDAFGISAEGNWEGKNIFYQRRLPAQLSTEYHQPESVLQNRIDHCKQTLLAARQQRTPPAKDDKILTAWNGFMISAMCKAYQVLADNKYLFAAEKAVAFLLEKMYINDQLMRSHRRGKCQINGYLSDYASLSAALIDLYESTFKFFYLQKALEINQLMLHKFWDHSHQVLYFTASEQNQLLLRTRNPYDNAMPAGNSTALMVMLKLARFTNDEQLEFNARKIIERYSGQLSNSPLAFSALISTLDFAWDKSKEIVVVGIRKESRMGRTTGNQVDSNNVLSADAMIRRFNQLYLPNKILVYADPELTDATILSPILKGKSIRNNKPGVLICENSVCKAPLTTIEQINDFHKSLLADQRTNLT